MGVARWEGPWRATVVAPVAGAASPQEPRARGQAPRLSGQLCVLSADRLEAKVSAVRQALPVLFSNSASPLARGVASRAEASVPKRGDSQMLLLTEALKSVYA